jgi:hypothetical protein
VFEALTVVGAVVGVVLVLFWFARPKRPDRDPTNYGPDSGHLHNPNE